MKKLFFFLVLLLPFFALPACQDPDDGTPEDPDPQSDLQIDKYVEYRKGDCPVILTAPHGGTVEEPFLTLRSEANCPDPDFTTTLDYKTRELADEFDKAFYAQTGHHPYVVLALIRRSQVDLNRKREYAIPAGDLNAGKIYDAYHGFVSQACTEVTRQYGHGLLLDIHGQSRSQQIDLGYLLSASTLGLSDEQLDAGTYAASSSIAHLVRENKAGLSFSELLRGDLSFGGLLFKNGLECVPRPANPAPGAAPYYSGGHITRTYGSAGGGVIDAIQCEFRYSYRDSQEERVRVAAAVARTVGEFTEKVW